VKTDQLIWNAKSGWTPFPPAGCKLRPDLVLVFGGPAALHAPGGMDAVRQAFPAAAVAGCSTAGEIHGVRVSDATLIVSVIEFSGTMVRTARVPIAHAGTSYEAGRELAAALPADGLRHAFVLSDGLLVNGSELVRGLTNRLPANVVVTGGLSGDGPDFKKTYVLWNGRPEPGIVTIVGFYGDRLEVGCGSLGGWDPFGPERLITRSKGNILYELDGRSALALYKSYLGDHATGLPATGLLFPLSLRTVDGAAGVVRTILSVDEAGQSLTFAGDIPEGAYARLMKANFDRLIDGAVGAAQASRLRLPDAPASLAILISCVGRKLVLGQRIEEEVEGVRDVLGTQTTLCGFYSYGEISPFTPTARCELHNQTMTITTLAER
jgi:hypothetical protein